MTLVIDRNNEGTYVDLTDILVNVPRVVGLTGALGIFSDNYLSLKTIEIARIAHKAHILKDSNWDSQDYTIVERPTRGFLTAKVPHFAVRDAIKPSDIDGIAKFNDIFEAAGLAEVDDVRIEKATAIRGMHDLTMEVARMQLLMSGTVYAPNGTLAQTYGDTIDWYQEFGETRQTFDLELSGANDPRISASKVERAMRMALRNFNGGQYSRIMVLCGTDYFDAVYTNPFITDAVKVAQLNLDQMLLLGKPGSEVGYDANFRTLTFWGLTFVDCGTAGYDAPDGKWVQYIEADKAVVVPLGVRGMFKTHYAPANTFKAINKKSQGSYYAERINEEDDLIMIKSEQNFLNVLMVPGAVFDLTKS